MTPEPVPSSPAIAMSTGALFVQPEPHGFALQVSELEGALLSTRAVKLVPLLERPALFCAVTEPDCVVAPLVKL